MNCCNDFGKCTQGANCPIRRTHTPQDWRYPTERPSPHKEVLSDAFYFIGFVIFVALICAIAGLAWGLFNKFFPELAGMLIYLFS